MPKPKRIIFNLKHFWKVKGKTVDLYEEIKAGRKTSEWRDATPHWIRHLHLGGYVLNTWASQPKRPIGSPLSTVDLSEHLFADKAWFVVGYPKDNLPRLEADITGIIFHKDSDQFEIKFANIEEVFQGETGRVFRIRLRSAKKQDERL